MAYPPEFIEELRHRVGIAEVVGRRVALKKRGREYTGLCPFHNEKTPSFTVSDDKGFFHCFGCGAHGSAIDFVMRTEGLSFPETVERLAGQAGMEVPRVSAAERARDDRRSELLAVVEAAAGWFESQLAAGIGAEARAYVDQRGLRPDTVAGFRIGFAPNRRDALKTAMLARDFTEAQLIEAGLLISPEDGGASYDRFRDRLMFPITDRRGRVIAFGGRALSAQARAKYLNSPETPLFHKGRVLYNHANARIAAQTERSVVLAEGYMDVIALAQAGLAHAVAPLGTAVTEEQLGELWRLAPEPVLCLDGDTAGWRAALRAAERALPLLKPGYSLRFALLPEGRDPDDLIKDAGPENGATAIRAVLETALPLSELLWRKLRQEQPIDTPERRAAFGSAMRDLAGRIGDPRVREFYLDEFNEKLTILLDKSRDRRSFRSGRQARGGYGHKGGRQSGYRSGRMRTDAAPAQGLPPASRLKASLSDGRRDEKLLAMLVFHPTLIEPFHEVIAALKLANPDLDRLRTAILELAARRPDLDSASLKSHLVGIGQVEIVDRIAGPKAANEYWFARPDVKSEEVAAGLHQALARRGRVGMDEEIRARQHALAAQMSPEVWENFRAIKDDELRPNDSDEADVDRLRGYLDREKAV